MAEPATTLSVWYDPPEDGPTNMAADECLAAEADRSGELCVRLYGWSQTTISLGGFQGIAEARQVESIRGLPLVRRPSGGGAIVHGSDLTYAAAVPKGHPCGGAPQVLYDALHGAMVEELAARGLVAWPAPAVSGGESFFCFDRRAVGDLVMGNLVMEPGSVAVAPAKIMGSAQRRLAGVVLQHGSLLLASNPELREEVRHPGIADLAGQSGAIDACDLARGWVGRIAAALGARVSTRDAPFLRGREEQVAAAAARFREESWTARR
jgi:lipoate-protein ligase A